MSMKVELTNFQIGAIGGVIVISSIIVFFILNNQKKQIQNNRLFIEHVKRMVNSLNQFGEAFYKLIEFKKMVNHEEIPYEKDHFYEYTDYAKKYNCSYYIEKEKNDNE